MGRTQSYSGARMVSCTIEANAGQPVALSGAYFREGLRSRWPCADKPECCLQGPRLPPSAYWCLHTQHPILFRTREQRCGSLALSLPVPLKQILLRVFNTSPMLEVKVPVPPTPNSLETRTQNSLAPGGDREFEERRVKKKKKKRTRRIRHL